MASTDPYNEYVEPVRRALGPYADAALNSPAWGALGATLRHAQRDGHDIPTFLSRTVSETDLFTARDVAALLTYRLQRELAQSAPAPTASASAEPTSRIPATAVPLAAAAASAEAGLWRERQFGGLTDEDLATELAAALDQGRRGAILAREAQGKATTALEVARSSRGPASQSLEQHYRQLTERTDAMQRLVAVDQEYASLRLNHNHEEISGRLAATEYLLEQRRWFGTRMAVRGEERGRLQVEADRLRTSLDTTPQRLAELDKQWSELEKAAGPAVTRHTAYTEWTTMERTLPQLRDTARTSDVGDAQRRADDADRMRGWAQDQAERHTGLDQEITLRAGMRPERAAQERAGRTRAAAESAKANASGEDQHVGADEAEEAYNLGAEENASESLGRGR